MTSNSNRPAAYSGSPPGSVPLNNAFAFAFSQPFHSTNDFTPPEQIVPRIEATRPIFVDHKTGMDVVFMTLLQFALVYGAARLF
jgi:hypothetical protein